MTISETVRSKVLQFAEEGKGRNQIARLLQQQGLHISEGSVGNIIRQNRSEAYTSEHGGQIVKGNIQPTSIIQLQSEPEPVNSVQERGRYQ
jgi:hypothetical protein